MCGLTIADDNLYVGTSEGEILHFVSLPSDPSNDAAEEPSFILASRLPIASTQNASTSGVTPAIRQIMVLPSANKACILCNGVVTFYSLPELSPTYGTTKIGNCNWIGGIDLNESSDDGDTNQDPTIMIAVQSKIMLVRIGDEPRLVRNIEYPGCLNSTRRDTIACVADAYSYSLIEVEQRQKIPLFPISSEASGGTHDSGLVEDMPSRVASPGTERPDVANGSAARSDSRSHRRNTSFGAILGSGGERSQSRDRGSRTPEPATESEESTQPAASPDQQPLEPAKPLPDTPIQDSKSESAAQKPLPAPPKPVSRLKPHIASPTPSEFLLVTGTEETEPGVGVFVNLDGEVAVRGTLSFQRYPKAIVVDSGNGENQSQASMSEEQGGHILAVIEAGEDSRKFIEAQRWDIDPGEGERPKSEIPIAAGSAPVGLGRTVSGSQTDFADVARLMQMVRLKSLILDSPASTPPERSTDPRTRASIEQFQKERELFDGQDTDSETSRPPPSVGSRQNWEAERNQEEQKFASGLGKVKSNIVLWSGNQIWRVVRNPWALQLESVLQVARSKPTSTNDDGHTMDRDVLSDLVHGLDNVTPKTETEFLGLRYVKQKASLLLFADLISSEAKRQTPEAVKATEDALIAGDLDPRVILLLVPLTRGEIVQGSQGIWLYGGIAEIVGSFLGADGQGFRFSDGVLQLLVRYLLSWQKKRGYGSVPDDTYVFNSVDGALLRCLLEFDAQRSTEQRGSTRTELNKLVDNWKGDFDKGVQLLESYERLYVLSRLYQSRKMAKHVLGTWRRIIEGEKDTGGELSIDGAETQVRKYLVKLRDMQLVEDYGSWLAARNPKLGIQVFADESSRTKLDPSHVVSLLKTRASDAVQYYLEHLVFTKNVSLHLVSLLRRFPVFFSLIEPPLNVSSSIPNMPTTLSHTTSTQSFPFSNPPSKHAPCWRNHTQHTGLSDLPSHHILTSSPKTDHPIRGGNQDCGCSSSSVAADLGANILLQRLPRTYLIQYPQCLHESNHSKTSLCPKASFWEVVRAGIARHSISLPTGLAITTPRSDTAYLVAPRRPRQRHRRHHCLHHHQRPQSHCEKPKGHSSDISSTNS